MATMHTTRIGKVRTHKSQPLGELTQVSGNGHGGSERLAKTNRLELVFERGAGDGVTIRSGLWLDFDEAVKVLARAFKTGGVIDDVVAAARGDGQGAGAPIDAANAIARLQEINRTLLPDFPGKTPSADSVGLARAQIMALLGDIKGKA